MTWLVTIMLAFGHWLKSTPLAELSVWVAGTKLGVSVNQNSWITPTTQSIHILAIAATFSAALMINLRIWQQAGAGHSMAQVSRRYTPWIWWGIRVLVVTGIILVIAEPAREMLNPGFWTKMFLIVLVALTTAWFQKSVQTNPDLWLPTSSGYPALRYGAVGVTVIWFVIIILGRWIAYIGA